MEIKKINIIDYKNISNAELEFSDRINCFVGDNGAGKTNMLDAIYYLSLCKSINGAADSQCIKHGSRFFMLEGDYVSEDSHNTYMCSFTANSSVQKTIKRNGKNYSKISEHIGAIPLVAVTPSDNSLIDESGESRRKYLNTFISQINPHYLHALIKYNAIISQRNFLLKWEMTTERRDTIEIYDMQLGELAEVIYKVRKEIIAELSPTVCAYYNLLAGGGETVELTYSSALENNTMAELLKKTFEKDCQVGHTTSGVGRDDLRMKIDGYPIKRFGSQGQQKSFIIAMKLAQYDIMARRSKLKPILLLDDIFDRLDNSRVESLLSFVGSEKFGQIFITDCNNERMDRLLNSQKSEYKIFKIKNQ